MHDILAELSWYNFTFIIISVFICIISYLDENNLIAW